MKQPKHILMAWNPPNYSRTNYILKIFRSQYRLIQVKVGSTQGWHRLGRIRVVRQLLMFFNAFCKALKERPVILIVFSPLPSSILGVLLGYLFRIPVIFDLYYSWVESQLDAGIWQNTGLYAQFARFLEGVVLRSAKSILVDTHSNRKYFSEIYGIPASQVYSLYGVVDVKKFNPKIDGSTVRTKYHLGECPVVMYHGSFQHVHGVNRIIRLVPLVIDRVPNAIFLLVGMGPTYDECRRLTKKLSLEQVVIFPGRVKHDVLPEYLVCCDVWLGMFTLGKKAQRTARFGMFETMAVGKPVVTAKTREAKNVLTDGVDGFLVDPEDPEEVVEIILRLIKDQKLRYSVGRKARKRVKGYFSLKEMERILQNCLRQTETFTG